MNQYAIIEIGSNNTKTHIYKDNKSIYEKTTTIELKKNYAKEKKISKTDFNLIIKEIQKAKEYTENIYAFGCSIFRKLTEEELKEFNNKLKELEGIEVQVVSQEEEALLTALGCYGNINYKGSICIFIGGGGSIELINVENKKVKKKKFYDFGVVDITNKFESLKDDIPTCTFKEVYDYVDHLIGKPKMKADVLILAGGDHLYWYQNARYELEKNTLYEDLKQPLMLTREKSDEYDQDALKTSLDAIRKRSDNPLWFDGSRAMKVITNCISHKVDAKYIIPTKINMEDGIKNKLGE